MSVNPSIAEGLEVCTEAQTWRARRAFSEAGAGCPNASKIGTVEVETPLLDESVNGALYLAEPYENPFDSLLALYIVIKNPTLGIKRHAAAEGRARPGDGPADHGRRRPAPAALLATSSCTSARARGARWPPRRPAAPTTPKRTLYPWSGGAPVTTTSAFQIITGPEAGPCPSGGLPPFQPGLIAGTLNNAAGRFSPFNLRLFSSDAEQEITHFSIKLPPGVVGKLAGIPFCSDAAIAAAKARTGPHGGQEELDSPSCPAASEIGRTLVGARSRLGPGLRPRQALPGRPLQRLRPLDGRDHRRQGRSL